MQVARKSVVVTGGASGLGAATVKLFSSLGARVLIADIDVVGGAALEKELGTTAIFCQTDVTSEASVMSAVDAAIKKHDALHVLVCCAGIAPAEKLVGRKGVHSLAGFWRAVDVNLIGVFNAMRLAAAAMTRNAPNPDGERGVIVNTASIAAFDGQIGQCAYAASKAGVIGMTLPASRELAQFGIRVATVAPGVFDTPMTAVMPESVRTSLTRQVPFPQRFGPPEEFAALALHIVENTMINGEVIRLDGGLRMPPR
ncbi:MAG: SDR family NAD(P)-dependent oxidoreductase [Acidobacteria bacterium]|nr:SDR family NAD(P)-dependent oxidoreductase [Acidobacteriota bacterium]